VIGTRALVTKDVEPYTIIGGNPAKPIRRRFSEAEIALLLEMAWWEWPIDRLSEAMPLLTSADIERLHRFWRAQ